MVDGPVAGTGAAGDRMRAPLMISFLGSYTTFSTLALESWRMMEDGALDWRPPATWPGRCCSAWWPSVGTDTGEGDLMKLEGTGLLLRIYLGEQDSWTASRSTKPSWSESATRDCVRTT